MRDATGGYPRRPVRSDEDEPFGADFAEEHDDLSHAGEMRGGPEGVPDEDVPSGLAGEDPTEADH